MVMFVGMGERLSERFLPVYLISLGASALIPGFLNGLDVFLSAVYSIPGAYLSEKIGYKKSLLVFNLIAMFGYLIVIFIPNWIAVIVGSFFFLSWSSISMPAVMDLITKVVKKDKQTMGVSVHSLVRRIPMALGPIIGGILIDSLGVKTGIRISFAIAFGLGFISIFFQQLLIEDSKVEKSKKINFLKTFLNFNKELKILLLSDILIRFCEQIPYAYLAIWAMENKSGALISAKQFGVLTAIEMVVSLLIYIPVAYFADKGYKKAIVTITFFNFAIFPLTLIFAKSFYLLIIAFVVRGLKEFGEPTRKTLINHLAKENEKTASFGIYYLVRDIFVSVAPFLGAYLFINSPNLNFIIAFIFGIIGFIIFLLFGKDKITNL